MSTEIQKQQNGLITTFATDSEAYLKLRVSDNPEFHKKFIKTFGDMIFSQNDEMLEKLQKTNRNSLMNAVFKATEVGASFAKKEVSFIPFEIFKKTFVNGVEKKQATGEFEALVIFDINFQKQLIFNLENSKRFFTCEIRDGVQVIEDMSTGNYVFVGTNDVTKNKIGYYACFIDTDDQKYDLFMSCSEIVERAKFSPQFKADKYKETKSNIHYEKIVVRNLLKIIPKKSRELSSILSYDEASDFTDYEDVTEQPRQITETASKPDAVEDAKKEIEKEKEKQPAPAETTNAEAKKIEGFF